MANYYDYLVANANINLCVGAHKARYLACLSYRNRLGIVAETVVASNLRTLRCYVDEMAHNIMQDNADGYWGVLNAYIDDLQYGKQILEFADNHYIAV